MLGTQRLADEYEDRACDSQETGGDTRTAECGAWLRTRLRKGRAAPGRCLPPPAFTRRFHLLFMVELPSGFCRRSRDRPWFALAPAVRELAAGMGFPDGWGGERYPIAISATWEGRRPAAVTSVTVLVKVQS